MLIVPYLVRSNTHFPCISNCGSEFISLEPNKYLLGIILIYFFTFSVCEFVSVTTITLCYMCLFFINYSLFFLSISV